MTGFRLKVQSLKGFSLEGSSLKYWFWSFWVRLIISFGSCFFGSSLLVPSVVWFLRFFSIGHFGVLDSSEGSILRRARFFGGLVSSAGSILRWARFFGSFCGLFGRLTDFFSALDSFLALLKSRHLGKAAYFISSEIVYWLFRNSWIFDVRS